VHLSLDVVLVIASLVLSVYCLRLLSKFLKGGIFEAPFRALLIAGLLFMIGTVFDMMAGIIETSINLHWFHISLDILSMIVLIYGARELYQVTTRLSQ